MVEGLHYNSTNNGNHLDKVTNKIFIQFFGCPQENVILVQCSV